MNNLIRLITASMLLVPTGHAIAQATTRESVSSAGVQGNFHSTYPSISADGRFIAFDSGASNLVAGDTNFRPDVFVRDRVTGQSARVSVSSAGVQGTGNAELPSISADGRFVAFMSSSSTLVAGDSNNVFDIFVHDRQTGTTSRVSVSTAGVEGNSSSRQPSISPDGNVVVFESAASNLVAGDTNGAQDVFAHDRLTGQTTRVSVASNGSQGNGASGGDVLSVPRLSGDGRFVAFQSRASNLVPVDNAASDVFVHDRQTGQTTKVSVSSAGAPALSDAMFPSISNDGRFVAFSTTSSNLVPGDTNGLEDVFVHDRQTGETTRVSMSSAAAQGNGVSTLASISGDGGTVVFWSLASNLVAGDVNGAFADVFAHDRGDGQTTLMSVATDGAQGDGDSREPVISADGRFVAFMSLATTLVAGDTNGFYDVFVRDRGAACPGDTNGDGVVNFNDLNQVVSDFGMVGPGLAGDLDGDNDVDFADLNVVLGFYGVAC